MSVNVSLVFGLIIFYSSGTYAQWSINRSVDKMYASNAKVMYFSKDLNGNALGGFATTQKDWKVISEIFYSHLASVNGCPVRDDCKGRLKLGDKIPKTMSSIEILQVPKNP